MTPAFLLIRLLITSVLSLSFGNTSKAVSDIVETLLNVTTYNSKIRPLSDDGIPLEIYININVNEISSISEVQMFPVDEYNKKRRKFQTEEISEKEDTEKRFHEYSLTCFLRQMWKDERLSYKGYNKSITLNFNQFERIWTPDLFIRNLKSGMLHTITVPNRLIRLSPDGSVLYSQRLSMTLVCAMQLDRYPMDNQTCFVEFGSYAYTTEDLIFKWSVKSAPVELNRDINLPEYTIEKVTNEVCSTSYNSTGSFPCLRANFHLNRRLKAYILTTYLPSLLVVLLSWLSFWIDPESTPARTSLSILTILTVTTQSSSLMRSTPAGSFTKASDVWMATCLFFVFAAFIEYSVVNTLSRKKKRNQINSIVDISKEFKIMENHTARNKISSNSVDVQDSRNLTINSNNCNCSPNAKSTNKQAALKSLHTRLANYLYELFVDEPALFVEVVARILFPFLFLLFNAVYWSFYLTSYTAKEK